MCAVPFSFSNQRIVAWVGRKFWNFFTHSSPIPLWIITSNRHWFIIWFKLCTFYLQAVDNKVYFIWPPDRVSSIIPSKNIPAELYFRRISHTEFRKNSVWKIPWNSAKFLRRNQIPRNSAEQNSVGKSNGIPWKIPWKIPAEFREKFRRNSVKIPVGFFVYNSYFYEPLRNSN